MEDFNSFIKNGKGSSKNDGGKSPDLIGLISSLSDKFNGKSTDDLLKAIYEQAKKGKSEGTLSNSDIDNFASSISPFLDDKQRKILRKIVKELKEI